VTLAYVIKLTPEDNNTLMVTCPALPEVTTFGEDEEDARKNALGAIEEAIAARSATESSCRRPSGQQRTRQAAMPGSSSCRP
jgi:antitoxin HicB